MPVFEAFLCFTTNYFSINIFLLGKQVIIGVLAKCNKHVNRFLFHPSVFLFASVCPAESDPSHHLHATTEELGGID